MASKTAFERRNLLILLLMVAILAGLAALAQKEGQIRIMPLEPPDQAALRKSPNNAFFALRSARDLLKNISFPTAQDTNAPQTNEPQTNARDTEIKPPPSDPRFPPPPPRPGNNRGPNRSQFQRKNQQQPLSEAGNGNDFSAMLYDWIKTRDERLSPYLAKCPPVIDKVRKAFAKPYYRCPDIGNTQAGIRESLDFRTLGMVMAASGLQQGRDGNPSVDAFGMILDTIKLSRMIASDGPFFTLSVAHVIERRSVECLIELASLTQDPALLRDVLTTLTGLTREPISALPNLEFTWRMMDNTLLMKRRPIGMPQSPRPVYRNQDPGQFFHQYEMSWRMKRTQLYIIKNATEFRRMIQAPYPEFRAWAEQSGPNRRHLYFGFAQTGLEELAGLSALINTHETGARIALALEIAHREKGAYPESLNALTPDILDQVPPSPLTGKPFDYEPMDGDYRLSTSFSNTTNGYRNGAMLTVITIHQPMTKPTRPNPQ